MKITIDVEQLEPSKMFFTESLGSGTYSGKPFDVMTAVPARSLIVSYEGERYMVGTQSLIEAILDGLSESDG